MAVKKTSSPSTSKPLPIVNRNTSGAGKATPAPAAKHPTPYRIVDTFQRLPAKQIKAQLNALAKQREAVSQSIVRSIKFKVGTKQLDPAKLQAQIAAQVQVINAMGKNVTPTQL